MKHHGIVSHRFTIKMRICARHNTVDSDFIRIGDRNFRGALDPAVHNFYSRMTTAITACYLSLSACWNPVVGGGQYNHRGGLFI